MQLLYAKEVDSELSDKGIIAEYRASLDRSYDLYLFSLFMFIEICRCSIQDKEQRLNKHLRDSYDEKFEAWLYHNPIIQSLVNQEQLQIELDNHDFGKFITADIIRKIYKDYSAVEAYKSYATSKEMTDEMHLEQMLELYRNLKKSEHFDEILQDSFFNWKDDKSLVVGAIKRTLKLLPSTEPVHLQFAHDEDTTENFGMTLVTEILKNNEGLLQKIQPRLDNWELDRLAILDVIILKMALCEMQSFPSIPLKATINEYLEIAKNYSTDKSKEFINGVLDAMMRELIDQGELHNKKIENEG